MNRSFVSALLSLAFLPVFPALAQTSGSAQPFVTLSVGANPTANGVALTGTVQPETPGSVPQPTGTLTFLDGTTVLNANGAALMATSSLTSQTFAQVFGTPDSGMASIAEGALVGDFDGDGKDDLLVWGSSAAAISMEVQLFVTSNSADRNFRVLAPQTLATPVFDDLRPTMLDVDGDGKLDLLVGNIVAYGSGDGTFSRVAVLPILANGFSQTYGVDVNGDGKLDILAVNTPPPPTLLPGTVQFLFTVFRNDGGGTFTSLGSFPLAPSVQSGVNLCCGIVAVRGLSFADLNGDGKTDVLSQSTAGTSSTPDQFNVMLNSGDGTFGMPKTIDTSAVNTPYTAAVGFGDLNDDGKNDLVLAYPDYRGQNFLAGALGNGDGTFAAFSPLLLINYITNSIQNPQVQLMEFDGDGKLDAIVGSGEVALGKGDGTFALSTPLFAQPANPQTPLNYPLLQMPIYAHSGLSLVYLNFASGANAVFTPQNNSSANATMALSAGTHTLTAQYSGDSTYAAGTSAPVTVTVAAPAPPTIMITSSANPIYASQPVTFTATLNDPTITGSLTFVDISKNDDNPLDPMAGTTESTLGTGTIANGVAALTTTLPVGGTHTILAVYGPDIYAPIAQGQLTETVNLPFAVNVSSTGVSLTASSGHTATVTLPVQALGGFTGPVTFECMNGQPTCSFSPATVNLSGAGTTNVTLTVTAAAVTATNSAVTRPGSMALACALPLLTLLGFAGRRRRRILLLVFGAALCVIPFTGCGGGGSSSSASSSRLQAGIYPFYITAASGQNVLVLQGTLTVQ